MVAPESPKSPGDAVVASDGRDSALTRALARRAHHRRRSPVLRTLTVAAGAVVCVIGLALLLVPELGLPLLVAGLGLLALEFDWAARALASLFARVSRVKRRLANRPRWHRAVFISVVAGVVLAAALTPLLARGAAKASEAPAARQLGWVLRQVNAARMPPSAEIVAHFSGRFLKAVPPASLITALSPISAERPVRIAGIVDASRPGQLVARLQTASGATLRVSIAVSAQAPNKIESLLFQPFAQPTPISSWLGADHALARLGSQAGLFAAQVRGGRLGPVVHARGATTELAIGSAFKLYVLGALAQTVSGGRASWNEQLPIREAWKSLPSGHMQNARPGTRFTLRHYAEQMISVSDNTAADHLIRRLGRGTVERELGKLGDGSAPRDRPFLTTREMFALKIAAPPDLRTAFSAAGAHERRQLLAQVDALHVSLAEAAGWTAPRSIETIEWFASPRALGRAMNGLQEVARKPGLSPVRSILALNPGIRFDPGSWSYIGYKGGSEPGVLSLTWYLERRDGKAFVLSIVVNDAKHAINEAATLAVAEGAAALLAHV